MIQLSEQAVSEIKRLQQRNEADREARLRIQVIGGGCSGMSYKLGFDAKEIAATDKTFDQDGVTLVVDSKSLLFLQNMTLDFTDGLNGQGFVFNNPNAKRTCGCGSSFSA